jgi:hypothetical protein
MSVVTNVILCAELDGAEELDALNEGLSRCYWTGEHGWWAGGKKFSRIPNDLPAGTKCLETDVLLGAFNHLVLDELISIIESLEWEWPEDVQLFVKGNEEARFREIPLSVRGKRQP